MVKRLIALLVDRWQESCCHPVDRRKRQRVGPLHELHWCSLCGAHQVQIVPEGADEKGAPLREVRMFRPHALAAIPAPKFVIDLTIGGGVDW